MLILAKKEYKLIKLSKRLRKIRKTLKVKEETEKVGLKLNIQKTKIMDEAGQTQKDNSCMIPLI